MQPKYRRVLLKLSGEALAGAKGSGLDFDVITPVCAAIKACVDAGAQIAVVVGGGNFWRGRSSGKMDRNRADHMGMLATTINALALEDTLEQLGCLAQVQTALPMPAVAEPFTARAAIEQLEQGRVVIFGCGTGNPFFSTDTAAALRALEIGADIFFKASMVDGVYDRDPHVYSDAVRFDTLTFSDMLEKDLKVLDAAASGLCKENQLPLLVFNMENPENIVRAVAGEVVGTVVHA